MFFHIGCTYFPTKLRELVTMVYFHLSFELFAEISDFIFFVETEFYLQISLLDFRLLPQVLLNLHVESVFDQLHVLVQRYDVLHLIQLEGQLHNFLLHHLILHALRYINSLMGNLNSPGLPSGEYFVIGPVEYFYFNSFTVEEFVVFLKDLVCVNVPLLVNYHSLLHVVSADFGISVVVVD